MINRFLHKIKHFLAFVYLDLPSTLRIILNLVLLYCAGLFVTFIIWARLFRERIPKDIPFEIDWIGFLIFGYLCVLYLYLLIKIIFKFNGSKGIIAKILSFGMFASVGIWIGWCGVLWCSRSLRRNRRFGTGLELLSTVISRGHVPASLLASLGAALRQEEAIYRNKIGGIRSLPLDRTAKHWILIAMVTYSSDMCARMEGTASQIFFKAR